LSAPASTSNLIRGDGQNLTAELRKPRALPGVFVCAANERKLPWRCENENMPPLPSPLLTVKLASARTFHDA
jgi:hypothetical protein